MWSRLSAVLVLVPALLAGCAPPLSVVTLDQREAYRIANRSALSEDGLSVETATVLRRHNLGDIAESDPDAAIAALHTAVVGRPDQWGGLFALAELSYFAARRAPSQARYLAAAVYAYAFLFPEGTEEAPDPYDPRFRQACDFYNAALSAALVPVAGGEAVPRSGQYNLPFGAIDVVLDEDSLNWGDRRLTGMVPTGALQVKGLVNQYRTPGIGAAMAARVSALPKATLGFQVAPRLRVPTTLLLRIEAPRRQLAGGRIAATLSAHNIFDDGSVTLSGRRVPLEYDETATRAFSLSETAIWDTELAGFLRGTVLDKAEPRLVALEPHRRGRIPVVLVHGTASSPFRWADMANDLMEVPAIRNRFEFWVFSYGTGNPIPYSAAQLHDSLEQAIATLGGVQADPALGHMVLVGHSQGGLLVKMQVIDPRDTFWNRFSRVPFEQLKMDDAARRLVRGMLFPVPVRAVDRVIFIATPHGGSFVAGYSIAHLVGRLVTLPLSITRAGAEILAGNAHALVIDPSQQIGSTYGMTPGSPFIRALAATPIVPGVHVHSIIPTLGDGPLEERDDGVVAYRSAHIEGVDSELVVPSGHSTQANPLTIAEVQRILLLEASAACAAGVCGPAGRP